MNTTDGTRGAKGDEEQERDAVELAEAFALAAEVPAAWVEVAAGELPLEAAFPADKFSAPEIEEARELFAPLEANTRERIVDRAVDGFLRDRPRPQSAPDEAPRVRRIDRRRWLVRLGPPLAAAAAAASLTLFLTHPGAPEFTEITGRVRAASADRAPGEASILTVEHDAWFFLDCRAEQRSIKVLNVRAMRSGTAAEEPPRGLGWTVITEADDGAMLHVAAALPPGTWQVACDAFEPGSGRLIRLGPPASVVIE